MGGLTLKNKLLIYTNNSSRSRLVKEEFLRKAQAKGLQIVDDQDSPDYIVTIGGDGTLLQAFHQFQAYLSQAQFVGIHTGHLGFYTDWQPQQMDELIQFLSQPKGQSITYPLLQVTLRYKDGKKESLLALNEFTLRSNKGTIVSEVFIKDYFFETFRGDGLCVATPTGSTGLSKSLGGAVIHPRLDALQMTEMASINNRVYRTLSGPIIIAKDEWIKLIPIADKTAFSLSVDHLHYEDKAVQAIRVQIAQERIAFASFKHLHFWNRVEGSFIGRKY